MSPGISDVDMFSFDLCARIAHDARRCNAAPMAVLRAIALAFVSMRGNDLLAPGPELGGVPEDVAEAARAFVDAVARAELEAEERAEGGAASSGPGEPSRLVRYAVELCPEWQAMRAARRADAPEGVH